MIITVNTSMGSHKVTINNPLEMMDFIRSLSFYASQDNDYKEDMADAWSKRMEAKK